MAKLSDSLFLSMNVLTCIHKSCPRVQITKEKPSKNSKLSEISPYKWYQLSCDGDISPDSGQKLPF